MDYVFAFLGRLIHDQHTLSMAFIAATGAAVFALGLAVLLILSTLLDPMRARIRALSGGRQQTVPSAASLARQLDPLAQYILPRKIKERSEVEQKLIHAGYRSPNALMVLYSLKTLFAIGLPAAALPFLLWAPKLEPVHMLTIGLVLSGTGLLAPSLVVERALRRRTRRLRNGLPDALDLLVVCTEAGLGLKAAIQRVADELSIAHPELAQELAMVNAETRAGVDQTEALHNLAERTGLDDIRGLVSLLAQSMRFGTSVAETLRVYAAEFRDKRMQLAEEQAAKIGTKMIFPLVLCLFPSFFVVVVGPAVIGVIRVLQGLS